MIIALAAIASFFFMEFVAWFAHKYIMHGFLWSLHEDHHKPDHKHGFFEKNDYFFLIFATPGAALLFFGSWFELDVLFGLGVGISVYGMAYFIVHDIFIHQRFKVLRKTDNAYLRAIRRAHKIHHKHLGKEDGECFGMLLVPYKYIHQELQQKSTKVFSN